MLTPLAQRAVTAVRRRGQLLVPNRVTVSPTPPPPEPRAWASFTKHAQLDAFISDEQANITPPAEWADWTIAQKKAWLDASYGATP